MTKEFKKIAGFLIIIILILFGALIKIEYDRIQEWENVDIMNKYNYKFWLGNLI